MVISFGRSCSLYAPPPRYTNVSLYWVAQVRRVGTTAGSDLPLRLPGRRAISASQRSRRWNVAEVLAARPVRIPRAAVSAASDVIGRLPLVPSALEWPYVGRTSVVIGHREGEVTAWVGLRNTLPSRRCRRWATQSSGRRCPGRDRSALRRLRRTSRRDRRFPLRGRSGRRRPLRVRPHPTRRSRACSCSPVLTTHIVGLGNRQNRIHHVRVGLEFPLQAAQPPRDRRFPIVAGEIHACDEEKLFGANEFQPEVPHRRHVRQLLNSRYDRLPQVCRAGFAGQESAVAVDQ